MGSALVFHRIHNLYDMLYRQDFQTFIFRGANALMRIGVRAVFFRPSTAAIIYRPSIMMTTMMMIMMMMVIELTN